MLNPFQSIRPNCQKDYSISVNITSSFLTGLHAAVSSRFAVNMDKLPNFFSSSSNLPRNVFNYIFIYVHTVLNTQPQLNVSYFLNGVQYHLATDDSDHPIAAICRAYFFCLVFRRIHTTTNTLIGPMIKIFQAAEVGSTHHCCKSL